MSKIIAIASLFLTVSISTLMAQDQSTRVDARRHVQRARMVEGRIDGDITRREARALRMQQRGIRRAERRAEADGIVTLREKRRLERRQNHASRSIRRAKHNNIERKD